MHARYPANLNTHPSQPWLFAYIGTNLQTTGRSLQLIHASASPKMDGYSWAGGRSRATTRTSSFPPRRSMHKQTTSEVALYLALASILCLFRRKGYMHD